MKKSVITICLLMAFVMVFAAIAMAEGEDRSNSIIVKVGVMIPTNDEFDTLTDTNWTLEGEYVIYSTDYIDFAAIMGYWRTGMPNALFKNQSAHLDNLYYMGGMKLYPYKEDLYIGAYVGGVTTWISPDPAPVFNSSNTAFGMKGAIGYEIEDHFVIEASYIGQFNEDLTQTMNWHPSLTAPGNMVFQSNSGVQLMGGYKF